MSLEASISFFIAIFVFGITPGPGTFALLSKALTSNAKEYFPMTLGMTISDIVYLILATFGLAAIAENYSGVFLAIRIIGAAYLIYLGWKMWTAEVNTSFDQKESKSISFLASFIQGLLISASNPKVILFYIAFLPAFMDLTQLSTTDIFIVSMLTFFALMIGLMMVSYGAASIKRYLKSETAILYLNRTASSMMVGAGIFLLSRGSNQ